MTEKISEWLETAIKFAERRRKNVAGFRVVIETERSKTNEVIQRLRKNNIKIIGNIENFIVADIPDTSYLDLIARDPYVKYVSYEKKFWPMAHGLDELIKRIAISTDPLLKLLSTPDLQKLGFNFKPTSEIPNPFRAILENVNVLREIIANPSNATKYIQWSFPFAPPVLARAKWKLVTYTRELLGVPKDNRLTNRTFVAVIDSGVRYGPGLGTPFEITTISMTLYPEPPVDCMSHGSWCHACAFGKPAITRFGHFYPVTNAPKSLHVKVFTAFGGCSGYQVMKAMEICAKKGCRVVSMSLGGTLTEPVDKDPECKLLDSLNKKYGTIFVVAAGNEDGKFEIGSPGAALRALTVAALDWKDKYKTSSYSSRGFQGKWYLDHKDVFEEHLEKYGDVFVKPDCGGIGGDRNSQIVSACSPWYDGIYDFVPDGWDMMIGCVVGDTVVEAKDIVALYKYRNDITYELVTEKHHLIGNWRHLVLTDKGWKMLKDITADDKVFTKDGIEKIVCCKEYGKEPVYDMTTRSHIYIANGIISHNTSMATPHVAGMVALLVDRGVVKTVDEIKNVLRRTKKGWNFGTSSQKFTYEKSDEQGWGVFHWKRFSSV